MKPDSGNTPPSDSSQPISASAAFRNKYRDNPEEYERIVKPAKLRLALFLGHAESEHKETNELYQQHNKEIKILRDKFHAQSEASKREWKGLFGCPYPETAEDWDRLAIAVGISHEIFKSGDYTLADVVEYTHAFQDRERMRAHALKPADSKPAYEANTDLRPARWFNSATEEGLYPALLRVAKSDGRLVDSQKVGGSRWHHSIKEVAVLYPEYRAKIEKAKASESIS